MATRRPRGHRRQAPARPGAELCSLIGDPSVQELSRPEVGVALKTARHWAEVNYFIAGILHLKQQFLNYGLRVSGDLDPQLRMQIEKYIASVASEWLVLDNVVSFWRGGGSPPLVIPAERCRYSDVFGRPRLWVSLGLTQEQLRDLPIEQRRRYGSEFRLDPALGEHFEVLTRAHRGMGFGYPRMASLFRACTQAESMEVGEQMMAQAGRCVLRLHSLGWEVRSSSGARQMDAMWTKARASQIEKEFQDAKMVGVRTATANFDHKISHIWALNDAKIDGTRWRSVLDRMIWWGGPLAFMLTAKTLNPDLMPAFVTEIMGLRAELRAHMEFVISSAIKKTVRVSWGRGCFSNPKLFWDMLKTLMEQGPLSLGAALRAADVDVEEVGREKISEADDPNRQKKFLPLFDRSHGKRPSEPGRPQGTRNGEGESS